MENVFRDEKFYFVHPPRNPVIKVIQKNKMWQKLSWTISQYIVFDNFEAEHAEIWKTFS